MRLKKEQILQTAEKLFAQKGFDGARVDDIALKAGVNKALIYYYFKSKQHILEAILEKHMDEIFQKRKHIIKSMDDISKEKSIESLLEHSLRIFENREDFLKIVFTEELKSVKQHWPLFQLLDQGFDKGFHQLEQFGIKLKNENKIRFIAFFFANVPLSMFIMLRDEWIEYYNAEPEQLTQWFLEAMKKMYVRYLMEEMTK